MKASVIRQFGGPDSFEHCDVNVPSIGHEEVLVRVLACGINHYDLFLRKGDVTRDLSFPHVMGADVVGEIEEVGSQVQGLTKGDRVIVAPGYPLDPAEQDFEPINLARSYSVTGGLKWGGYAQFMAVPARFVIPNPPDLPAEQLATIPLVLVTAVHAVKTLAQVSPGQKVLVQAGASGSGAMCVQMARVLGADVAATVGSDEKIEFVKQLGAELVINYQTCDFLDQVKEWTNGRGVDAVIDNVGGSVFEGNIRALKRGGHFVNFGMVGGHTAPYAFPLIFYKHLHLHGSMMGSTEELTWGLEQVRAGRIKPILDQAMPLRDAAKAHEHLESRRTRGKVVLLPW